MAAALGPYGRIAAELVALPVDGSLGAALTSFFDVAQRHEAAFVALLRGGSGHGQLRVVAF